jgi:NTE family protein
VPGRAIALEETPLFRDLSGEEMACLRQRLELRTFRPNTALLRCGEEAPGIYVLRSGLVSVVALDDAGSEHELSRLGKGECIGDMALATGEPCSATVRALDETEAWFLGREDFANLVDGCPGLWRNLGKILSERLVQMNRQVAARPSANIAAVMIAGDEEIGAALALSVAASLARQMRWKILVVDSRDRPLYPAPEFERLAHGPHLREVLHNRESIKDHLAPIDGIGGGAVRTTTPSSRDERHLTEEEALTAREWRGPAYDCFLLLLPGPPSHPWLRTMARASSILLISDEAAAPACVSWHQQHGQSPTTEGKVELALHGPGSPRLDLTRAITRQTGRAVRWLPTDGFRRGGPGGPASLSEAGAPSPLGRAVDRIARHLGRCEVGLALGAGAAKGFAHIGVLRVLAESGVPVDYIAGCSIGAVVGALYAAGFSLEDIEQRLQGADRKLMRWTLPLSAVWSDAGLRQLLRDPAPTVQFHELATPFAAVATDLGTGRAVVLREGLVWRAVQASVSIPGIFPPTPAAGRYLVDGGLVNPVPSETVRQMGADVVIAVDLSTPVNASETHVGQTTGTMMTRRRPPNLVEMLWRSTEIMQGEITARTAAHGDVTIMPRVGRSRWNDFSRRGQLFMTAGERATREALPELSRLLPFLAPSATREDCDR